MNGASSASSRASCLRSRADEGFSLVELLVAMSVGSLLLVCLGSVFVADLRTTTGVRDRTTANAEVRLAADVIGRRLRVATPPTATSPAFVTMTPAEVSFHASVQDRAVLADPTLRADDPPLTLVTYRYDTGRKCMTESLARADGTTTTTCLVRGTAAGQPLFTYYDATSGGTTTAVAADVRSVGIDLRVTISTAGRPVTSSVSTRVTCPNTVPRSA